MCAGQSKHVPPMALLVRSGDAMVLAGASRLCYHGLPRIFAENGPSHAFRLGNSELLDVPSHLAKYMQDRRINVSIRDSQ